MTMQPPPDVFAAVMATGIVSIAARKHHYDGLSDALGAVATVGLVALVVLVIFVIASRRRMVLWDLTDPDVTLRLFTFVAACAVLDSRLADDPVVLCFLGAVALPSWLVLLVLTTRNMTKRSLSALRDQAHGAWELASVGTSGLAIVAMQVATHTGRWMMLAVAIPLLVLALCVYGLMTWLLLWHMINQRLYRDGFKPDSWILMGALAIATLAGDHVYQQVFGWFAEVVRAVTVLTWIVATLWIPPLIYFALLRINRHPALLRFHDVWWALVFPLGMYSVASYVMAAEVEMTALRTVSLVFFWDALAAWVIVVVAGLLRLRQALVRG